MVSPSDCVLCFGHGPSMERNFASAMPPITDTKRVVAGARPREAICAFSLPVPDPVSSAATNFFRRSLARFTRT